MNKLTSIITTNEYKDFIIDIKSKITHTQIKIASTVNSALIMFYWELGEMISVKQKETKWGSKFIEQMANDLKKEFPSLKGFSRTNLFYIRKFYEFYSSEIVHHDGGLFDSIILQIPWRHNVEIFNKSKTTKEALYYEQQTILNK
jgi:predicted nuclease of restriction endonuclease-like (RecB) superfamily